MKTSTVNNQDKITITEINIEDLDLLVKMRVDFILDLKPCDDEEKIEEMRIKTGEYLKDLVIKNEYIGFIGKRGNEPICCAGLLISKLPPLINSIGRVQGHVLNVFTYPEYRQMGYGKKIMEVVMQKAKEKNMNRLFLNATKMGEGLYKKLGFSEPEDRAMVLDL